jgi:glycosyltransferase involved in cell wall biosynthesis
MEQTLGSVTHYLNLRRQDATDAQSGQRWLPIEYQPGRLPWTITGSLLARRALAEVFDQIDGVFMHTMTLAPLSLDYLRKKPAILSTDGTPLNKRQMRHAYGLRPEGRLAERAKQSLYRAIFSGCTGFVAWSNWAKQSFVEDYGCREEHVAVIPPGIDLDRFTSGDRNHELPRILFVGGDFVRKGGDLLLDVFRRRLQGRAELEIVTRDPVPSVPGVRVHHNVQANSDQLRALYANSDVFALPTRADCYSLVCMEALAAGMPTIATRVGGIPDMIHEGETGYGIAVDDAGALGDALERLVSDRALRERMSLACRQRAVEEFDVRENSRKLFDFVRERCQTS